MRIEDVENLLEKLNELKDEAVRLSEKCQCCECRNKRQKCEMSESLENDFNKIADWMVGEREQFAFSKEELKEAWEKNHPDLPAPRVLITEKDYDADISHTLLMIDAAPLYFAEKGKCRG